MHLGRVLIADDHPLVRSGIAALLTSTMPDCVCCEAASLAEAIALLSEQPSFDLVTLDLDLPDAKQLDALSELKARFPEVPIAILSGNRDAHLARAALAAGAVGFISKTQKPDGLLAALQEIGENGNYGKHVDLAPHGDEERVLTKLASLTAQQKTVFKLVAEGKLNKQIAFELKISLTTTKAHVSAVLTKLEVSSRTQAVIMAKRYSLFP